jgi:multidrug efflux pump subunit AcrA (membrane-fusion protein)
MQHRKRWIVLVLIIAGLALAACGGDASEEGSSEPATVEQIEGTDLFRITLTPKAAERLDIQTAPVAEAEGGMVIPFAAVLYDADGGTWTYTNPEPLVFVREPVTVDRIEGDQAFLTDGPASGMPVVTVGVAELYGTELGIE